MKLRFFDSILKMEIISSEVDVIYCVPRENDLIILPCSEDYAKAYGHSDKSGFVSSVEFDYRFNTITIYVE